MKRANGLGVPIVFVVLAFAAYATILSSAFLADDYAQIGRVLSGDYSVTWGLEHGGFFRPVFIFSYLVNTALWGTNPLGYHVTNLLLHALNGYLVFILAGRWVRMRGGQIEIHSSIAFRVSLFAGLFFLLLPSHTESVSWISGRVDLLATIFSLAALIAFDSYQQSDRPRFLAYTLVLFMLALMAKESAICLPLIIIAVEIFRQVRTGKQSRTLDFRRLSWLSLSFAVAFLLYLLVRFAFLGTLIGGYGSNHHLKFRLSLLWDRLPKFVIRAVMPPLPDQFSAMLTKPFKSGAFILLAAVSIAAVSALIVYRRRLHPAVARKQQNTLLVLLLASFCFSLLPVITLGISVFETLGERFVYLPSVFSSIIVAYISILLIPNLKSWMVVVVCILLFNTFALHRSNQKWRQAAALSQSVIASLASLSQHDDILVLTAPGSLSGVPVNRTGLEDALRIFQDDKRINRVQVVAYLDLPASPGESEVVQNGEDVEVRLLSDKLEFSEINEHVECVEIKERTKQLLRIRLNDCHTTKDVFFFRSGQMIPVYGVPRNPSSSELKF